MANDRLWPKADMAMRLRLRGLSAQHPQSGLSGLVKPTLRAAESDGASSDDQHSIVLVIKLVYFDLVRLGVYLITNDVLYQAKSKLVCDRIRENDPVSYADPWAGKSLERNAGIPCRPSAVTPWQRAAGLDTQDRKSV